MRKKADSTIEVWRDVDGFSGIYQISSLGRFRSLDRLNSRGQRIAGKVFLGKSRRDGHVSLALSMGSRDARVTRYVHRLVAEAFIPNPNRLPCVGHRDLNRANNSVSNLYWTDQGDFLEASYATGKRCISGAAGIRGAAAPCSKINNDVASLMRQYVGTHAEAAMAFGVSHSLASKVRRGALWSDIKP